jgi:N-acetylglucosamine-6-phosphate deacetylase
MTIEGLTAERIFTGERMLTDHVVLIEAGSVRGVVRRGDLPAGLVPTDLGAGTLAPGFVDAQVNGGGGALFNATPDRDTLARMARAHARHGTTALLPTYITDRPEGMAAAIAAIREAIAAGVPGIAGLHLEGPFLSVARKGVHDARFIRAPAEADLERLIGAGISPLVLTVAPETVPPEVIRRLTEAGVIVSIGHSDAPYDTAVAAAEAGARGVTHVFNAMSQFGSREPGIVGTVLDRGDLWGGFVADGFHVHPASLRVVVAAKRGPARLFLITDAMPPAGAPGDVFELNGRTVTRRDGRLALADGTLAGSDLTMDRAVAFTVDRLGIGLPEALRMASLYPAAFLGLDRRMGRIEPGFRADLVHLGPDLAARATWIGGRPIDRD